MPPEPVEGEPVEVPPEPVEVPPELVEVPPELVEVPPELVEGGLAPTLQWFLITLYNGLGAHLPLPLDLSWEVRQALRRQLTALQQATAESAATQLLDQLQKE